MPDKFELDDLAVDALVTLLRRLVDMPGMMAELGMVPVEETAYASVVLPADDCEDFVMSQTKDGQLSVTFDTMPHSERAER